MSSQSCATSRLLSSSSPAAVGSLSSAAALDFQGFAKPSRLLPATEPNTYPKYVSDEIFLSADLDKCNSFYMLELRTSREFGSCLRDLNAAILLCLINANGESILQRISAVSCQYPDHRDHGTETIHFQRGSADIVTFKGPKLGKIESLWIGLESERVNNCKKITGERLFAGLLFTLVAFVL